MLQINPPINCDLSADLTLPLEVGYRRISNVVDNGYMPKDKNKSPLSCLMLDFMKQ